MSTNLFTDNLPIYPVIVPLLGAFLTPLLGRLSKKIPQYWTALLLLVNLGFVFMLAPEVWHDGVQYYVFGANGPGITLPSGASIPVRIMFEIDGLSVFMAISASIALFVASLYSIDFAQKYEGKEKYYTLVLLLAASMLGILLTGDLFNLFVFSEITSIASCGLIAFRISDKKSAMSAFNYMLLSTLGGLFILFAIGMYYNEYGVLNIAALSLSVQGAMVDKIALGLLMAAFAMKAGAVPMHMAIPDAYGESPAPVTMILVSASQTSLYALFRSAFVLSNVQLNTRTIGWIIITLGVLSMFVGVTMALFQHDIKRLMAYHAVSQTGYMMLGVGVAMAMLTPTGLSAVGMTALEGGIFHIFNHAMYKGLLFLTAGAIFYATKTRDLEEMGGLARKMPYTTVFFIIGAASIAGLPPFNGFASKYIIYESVFAFNPYLAIIAMLVSILTLASFVKVFQAAFLGPAQPKFAKVKEAPAWMLVSMGILSLICIVFGLWPNLAIDYMVKPAADALIHIGTYTSVLGGGA